MTTLAWSCCLITGGASGIGRALAEMFSQKGKQVIIAGRTEAKLQKACSELRGVQYITVDIADINNILSFVAEATSKFPQIDCLVNNAGICKPINLASVETEKVLADLDEEIDTNVRSVAYLNSFFLPHLQLKKTACIINVSSGLSIIPTKASPVYCATKAFIRSYTLSLRHSLMESNVKVVEIIPPLVESNLMRNYPDPTMFTKAKGSSALSMEEFISEVKKGFEAGRDEITAGHTTGMVAKWHDSFDERLKLLNGLK